MTDDELMARAATGDRDAVRVLVERWERPIFSFMESMLGSPEEAQDVTQETFLRLCQHASRYRAEGHFKSWLFRIAGNLARNKLKRRKIIRWVSLELHHDRRFTGEGPDEMLERKEASEAVCLALLRLPERQRQALLLRHYEDMSQTEVAYAMNATVSAVETLLYRAMQGLRTQLLRGRCA